MSQNVPAFAELLADCRRSAVHVEDARRDDPDVVTLCSSAFESVWQRAIRHKDFNVGGDHGK